MNKTDSGEITIKVLSNGDMTFDPSLKHLRPGESVKWIFTNGSAFTICFPDRSPFSVQQLHSKGEGRLEARIVKEAKGSYRYAVAALLENTIFVDVSCPQIVVQ